MIFLHRARLVILSQPKTGTTSLVSALSHRASIAINNPPQLQHMHYSDFMTFVAPWIQERTGLARKHYEVVSVMREPLDWLGSWFRYRTRDALRDGKPGKQRHYSGNVEFDTFVRQVLKPKNKRKAYAHVGKPYSVAIDAEGAIGCDRVFPYEDLSVLYEIIEERTRQPLVLERMNVSPKADLMISDETREALEESWQVAFDLHRSLTKDGDIASRFRQPIQTSRVDADSAPAIISET